MSIARYALAATSLLVLCGSMAVAAVAVRRRYLSDFCGAPARLAEAVIGLALLIAILEVLGALGLFSLAPIICTSIVLSGGIWHLAGRPHLVPPSPPSRRHRARAAQPATIVALILAAVLMAEWAGPTLQSYAVGIRTFDSLWYHLPWAVSFAQTGQITGLRFTDVEYLTAFYPATAELFHGLGIVLFARDTLSPALNLGWLGLVLLAAYCVGSPRGLGVLTLTGAAVSLATPMMHFSQAGSAANDVVGVFFLLGAAALLLHAEGRREALALAAVCGGLAVAVKLTFLAPVLALSVGAIWISFRRHRSAAAALWIGPAVLASAFWYLRNLIAVGSPLPWLHIPGFSSPAPPLQGHTGFSVADYLFDTHLWSTVFVPGLRSGLGTAWPVMLAAVVVGPLLCLFAGGDRTVRMLGLVALASLGAYVFTPESAAGPAGHPLGFAFNLRYGAPAVTLSLTILPLASVLHSTRRSVTTAVALVSLLVATLAQAQLWPSQHLAGALGVGAAVALLVGLRLSAPGRVLLLGAGLVIVAAAVAGYPWQQHYLRGRYAFHPGVSYLAGVWSRFRTVHAAGVGVVGTFGGFLSYPLFGLDDSNRVQYIARHGANGSFTPIATCQQWRASVNAARYRYLVTTPARDPWRPAVLQPSPEGNWTASDPAARLIFNQSALGQTISVYELRGPLSPANCP